MAIAILGADGNPFTTRDIDASAQNFVFTQHKLVFSGSYTQVTGDVLDLTAVASLVPSGSLPLQIFIEGNGASSTTQSGAGGYYCTLSGNALNNWHVRIFSAAGTELAAGAYPAPVT